MLRLYETATNQLCGTLSDRQYEILTEGLEEEDLEEAECTISADTIELLEDQGVEPDLLEILHTALGDKPEVTIGRVQGNDMDLDQLRTRFREDIYYVVDFQWQNIRVRNAAVRSRGGFSRNPSKPALRIDFNRYTTGQQFLGLKSLVLDNLWQHGSFVAESTTMARESLRCSRRSSMETGMIGSSGDLK